MAPPSICYSVLKCTITSFKTKLIAQFNFDGMIYVARKDGRQVKTVLMKGWFVSGPYGYIQRQGFIWIAYYYKWSLNIR